MRYRQHRITAILLAIIQLITLIIPSGSMALSATVQNDSYQLIIDTDKETKEELNSSDLYLVVKQEANGTTAYAVEKLSNLDTNNDDDFLFQTDKFYANEQQYNSDSHVETNAKADHSLYVLESEDKPSFTEVVNDATPVQDNVEVAGLLFDAKGPALRIGPAPHHGVIIDFVNEDGTPDESAVLNGNYYVSVAFWDNSNKVLIAPIQIDGSQAIIQELYSTGNRPEPIPPHLNNVTLNIYRYPTTDLTYDYFISHKDYDASGALINVANNSGASIEKYTFT